MYSPQNYNFCLSLSPSLPRSQVVSLRKCGISDPPTHYYLAEIIDAAKNERELETLEYPYELKQHGYGPLKLYVRARVSYVYIQCMIVCKYHVCISLPPLSPYVSFPPSLPLPPSVLPPPPPPPPPLFLYPYIHSHNQRQ